MYTLSLMEGRDHVFDFRVFSFDVGTKMNA